jgi:hypothetical protein
VLEEIDGFHEQSLEPCNTVGFDRDHFQSLQSLQKSSRRELNRIRGRPTDAHGPARGK